ncbi:conjugal transfer protein TrbK [Mesorhizobium sp. CU2]|uniref:putative entry exclusion protein TrbK-alt n=1 Tax=unclassified Mesorhizobium TaxID=325217 RepID=UPI001129C216|nr:MULTISPECIES: putative entry exclusion protein TrbK-alt [unclassified Mesorhizobium]TPN86560.1 conjugal transfer protein TrbK [Mesorhizobium sp. CU3]TPO14409.1 conjugal transfer protein TrbK [Mesorhizobium sp. CU2]
MNGEAVARIAAIVFVAVALAATGIEMSRKKEKAVGEGTRAPVASLQDPLGEAMRRCQVLGEAALRDDGCARLWAEQRDRFLGLEKAGGGSTGEPAVWQWPDAASHEAR